ncbi:cobalamin biosynthesis protein CobQ [Candidatus Gottesmanbacteria bacterium RBG_16_52_11]|uniref:Lipid II isoglutaminyl synthase (glutamine-hydrolyzing) subunit GatD n=1 Tax=Candidatus Gottesmanbacteria bacterium RBG_16_52_11 TaxID=1798374 RepID=A0A1F5YU49_9BACT|nr:MAG: cobalamin biosynthesis protein CobQ [Candidatus Gottesmanbacteria bacterium RBG_16_52_11]
MTGKRNQAMVIGWLYPELMSTYGDRGNVIVLTNRCRWRGIPVRTVPIDFATREPEIRGCDIILGGGAQDRQQGIVISDLRKNKKTVLTELFTQGTPGLFVCGSPQLLGHYYMTADAEKLEGLGIFDMVSRHFGRRRPRCIGNLLADIGNVYRLDGLSYAPTIIGFENHGGRTYLGPGVTPFAKVIRGFGNNGEDGTEGAVYRNCIATYSHGPFLSKNPHIADWLITTSLEIKYGKPVKLDALDDSLEWQAHRSMFKRLVK